MNLLFGRTFVPKEFEQGPEYYPWEITIFNRRYMEIHWIYPPHPVTVTTKMITSSIGNPNKPLFATVPGG